MALRNKPETRMNSGDHALDRTGDPQFRKLARVFLRQHAISHLAITRVYSNVIARNEKSPDLTQTHNCKSSRITPALLGEVWERFSPRN